MLERYAGALQFQAGIRHHMDRYADSTVMAEGFMESLVQGSGLGEIEPIFQSFISQPGVPLLSVALNCSEGKNPNLAVQQSRYAPLGSSIDPDASLWQIPICIRVSRGGVFTSNCTLLVEKEMQIDLGDDSCPDYVHPNADGAGYYRFSLDESGWHSLIENAENLTAAEALSLADSLDAAFSSGEVSSESYLYGLAVLVNHEDWGVADAATSYFEGVTNIIEANRLGVLEEAFRGIVGPRFRALDPDQDTQSRLLYRRLLRFMIVTAKDPSLRGPLAEQAAEVIGLDGDSDPASAPADQLETILSVGVQDMGEPFFNLLMKQATESQDPAFREAATGALARVENPVLVRKLQSAVLTGRFTGTEMVGIVFRQMARVKTTELTYAFVIENADTLIEMVPETFRSSTFPALGKFLCSNEQANGWHDFITLHGDQLPGYERSLAQATESVRLCAALRDRSASDLLVAAGRYAGG